MPQQLSLFEEPPPINPRYNLVFAVFPDRHAAVRVIDLGKWVRETFGLRGTVRPIGRLHVSLSLPRDIMRAPGAAIEIVSRVCKTVSAATRPFEIKFDRVMSFRGKPGNHPLVLVNENHGNDGIMRLQEMLSAEFARYLSATPKPDPHLTLLYDEEQLAPTPVDPVCWTVKEIVLSHSELGAKEYQTLGRWVFGG